MEYGLIGEKLGHSYAKEVHEALCDYDYRLWPLPTQQQAHEFMKKRNFKAINVTIPYKQLVIPYCALLEEKARKIGAVNTIVNRDGLLHGYNTDYDGFLYMAKRHGVDFKDKVVLVLGTGGTSHTVHAVAMDEGAKQVIFVSRNPKEGAITYEQAQAHTEVQIIINTTPAGMYPNVGVCHIQPADFPKLEAVLDAVYNPFRTELIMRAEDAGVIATGGLEMLVAQALYAARHFIRENIPESHIAPICQQIYAMRANISLIGMPSSGKTTIGRYLAQALGRKFVDIDTEIEKAEGRSPADIIRQDGEEAFRDIEERITARFSKENGQVISCGGGVVKRKQNLRGLHQNGLIVFIDRPVELLKVGEHRPLSGSMEQLRQMEQQRRPLYENAADLRIENSGDVFLEAAKAAEEAILEVFSAERT